MDDDQSVNLQQFLTKTNASIASKGVTFDNSFVNYSLCCPSRSTMLTGQYAHNHGVRGNQPPSGGYSKLAPTLGNSLPVWLQRSGYYTAHIGKFLNGYGTHLGGHRCPAGMERVVRLARRPRCLHRRDLHGLRVHAERERPARPLRRPRRAWSTRPPTRPTSTRRRPRTSSAGGRRARSRSTSPSRRAIRTLRRASCGCGPGNNPRAAPRYEGKLAGLTAPRDPSFDEAERLGQALQHQEPAAAHARPRSRTWTPTTGPAPRRCSVSTTWSRTWSAP